MEFCKKNITPSTDLSDLRNKIAVWKTALSAYTTKVTALKTDLNKPLLVPPLRGDTTLVSDVIVPASLTFEG
jgi:hypothetical protein